MHPTNILATLMREGPLNNVAFVATTHRGFGKMADETSTQVMTYMINKWMVNINWKEVYNVRDPPKMGNAEKKVGGEKNEKAVSICMVLKATVT